MINGFCVTEREISMITQKELKKLVYYNKKTGELIWKKIGRKYCRQYEGKVVGSISKGGYMETKIKGKNYKVHRLIWLYVYGEFPKLVIDHINNIKTDNRIKNLRDVDESTNARNRGLKSNNTSGYRGVNKDNRNHWIARITHNFKRIYLGYFKYKKDAIKARREAEKKYWKSQ